MNVESGYEEILKDIGDQANKNLYEDKRTLPEDITINLSKGAPIPKPNLEGHKWGHIIHDSDVIWLASWKENISGKNKYIFTSFLVF